MNKTAQLDKKLLNEINTNSWRINREMVKKFPKDLKLRRQNTISKAFFISYKYTKYYTNIFHSNIFLSKESQSRYQIRLFGENGNTGVILTRKTQ